MIVALLIIGGEETNHDFLVMTDSPLILTMEHPNDTIMIRIYDDEVIESMESFNISLYFDGIPPPRVTLNPSTAMVIIVDDDGRCCLYNNYGDDDNNITSVTVTVPIENNSTVAVDHSPNISESVLIGTILGAVLFLVVVISSIIFFYIKRAKKKKVDLYKCMELVYTFLYI